MSAGLKLLLVFGYHFPLFAAFAAFAAFAVLAYLARYDVEIIQKVFKRSRIVVDYSAGAEERCFFRRFTLMAMLVGVMVIPTVHLRRGHLESEELECLPSSTRRRMQWAFGLMVIVLVWVVLDLIYLKFIR